MTSPYLDLPRRQFWKALADTGRADYFRWTFKTRQGELVLSVGKAHSDHAASPDTCEVLLWAMDRPRRDLMPEDISSLLEPVQRFFDYNDGSPIARHMPDSILTALLFMLDYYYDRAHFRHSLSGAAS